MSDGNAGKYKARIKTKANLWRMLIALVFAAPYPRHASMPGFLHRILEQLDLAL